MIKKIFLEILGWLVLSIVLLVVMVVTLWLSSPVKASSASNIFQIRENDGFKIYKFQDYGVDCYVSVSKVHNVESISCVKRDK